MNLVKGVFYIVTKASNDKTFLVGDRIVMYDDGAIGNMQAGGWIESCDVAEATRGMEVEIDKAWVERKRTKLLKELAALERALQDAQSGCLAGSL